METDVVDFLWAVVGVVSALLINLDGRVRGPYFAFSEIIYGYPELLEQYAARSVWNGLIRRAIYPLLGGLLLGFLDRGMQEAAIAGFAALFLLIWPAVFRGGPPQLSKGKAAFIYVGLLAMGTGLGMVGWHVAEAFDSPLEFADFIGENLASVVVGVVLTAFGSLAVGGSGPSRE